MGSVCADVEILTSFFSSLFFFFIFLSLIYGHLTTPFSLSSAFFFLLFSPLSFAIDQKDDDSVHANLSADRGDQMRMSLIALKPAKPRISLSLALSQRAG